MAEQRLRPHGGGLAGSALVALLTVGSVMAQRADGPGPQDIAAQSVQPIPNMPAADASFDGLSSQDNQDAFGTRFGPPNTNGDVGPNAYVQVVNSLVRIYDKDGTPNATRPAPFKMSSVLAAASPALPGSSLCVTHDDGEAIVVYDQIADRWLLAQIAFTNPSTPPYHLCAAVSQTPDPAGAYFGFDFVLPGTNLPGNVRFGLWPDGYYMAANQYLNGGAFSGVGAFAFDRVKMLAGDASATFIYFNLGSTFTIGPGMGGMLPADFDGLPATAPPVGTPNYFAMPGTPQALLATGGTTSTLRLFAFSANFATPSASTFVERPESPVPLTAYDARSPGGANHIEQPAPAAAAQYLSSLQDRLMHRLAYRRFPTPIAGPNGSSVAAHESLVVTHTVNVGPNPPTIAGHQAAVRYYEFARPLAGGPFAERERATFAPDADNRWMASAAMDGQGNIGVGYSVSGPNTFPSVRYAGRLSSDLPNGLYQGEAELVAGSGVQLATSGAWGASSALTIDPDDCRFWYTNQYYTAASQASSNTGWVTRIGSFKFPGCNGPAGTMTGTVRDAATNQTIANALVTVTPGGTSSRTDGNGVYMRSLPPGTYTVTVSAATYGNESASGINVASGVTTSQDFGLTFTGGTLTGHVLNAATSAPIANARITITPGGVRTTTDASGLYTKALEPGTYTVTADADDFLLLAPVSGVPVAAAGTTTQDFALAPVVFTPAVYDSTLKVPMCSAGTSGCDSGALLLGRDTVAGGAEPHQPNTILNSCADGTLGAFHVDESIDRLRVSTIDGTTFEMGRTVQVSATVWARYAGGLDKLDLYYASNASGSTWTLLTTLTPTATGLQTLSAAYVLPAGESLQAVRARFRFQGSLAACTGGTANFSDQDDLVFGVNVPPIITTQPISQTVVTGQSAPFTVVASATPAPTYQWELSTNGGTSWTGLTNSAPYSGVTTATLVVANTTPAQSGFQYRSVVANGVGSATSAAATLTVTTPGLGFTPSVQDFGSVFTGASTNRTFTIQNTGNGTLAGSASLVSSLGATAAASLPAGSVRAVKPVEIAQIAGGADTLARELDGKKFIDGRLLVRFRDRTAGGDKTTAHATAGSRRLRAFGGVGNLELVQLGGGMSVKQALLLYRQMPGVLYAEPDYVLTTTAVPNDTQFTDLWGMRNTGQAGGTSGVDIRATQAWDITTGSSNVVVAIIDTGIDYTHPDLAANMFRNTADCNTNLVDDDGNGFVDDCHGIDTVNNDTNPMDELGHGTHVAGTIGAVGNNGVGVVGVNWNVRLMACKFLGQSGGSTSGAIACLDYVKTMKDRGVNIVATNNSWGGGGFSQALFDAIDAQRQRGILFVASAGNASSNNDVVPAYPANYELPNVISVAATTRTDALASFSDYGRRTVHLGAPGQEILSTTPGNSYSTLNGTSMAAPHVTGVAALLKAQDPTRDWQAIRNLILTGGVPTSAMANTITGRRLDALNAMTCSGRTVLSRMQPASSSLIASIGVPLTLSALHITCANPNGNVVVAVSPGGSTVTLGDDGAAGDLSSGDGIYSAQWTPASAGTYTLTFPGGDVVSVAVPSDYTVQAAPFSYRAIAGTNLNLTDDSAALVTSPFPILFGGNASVTGLFVNSNGNISLGAAFTSPFNGPLPTSGVSTLIAPFWDDLNPAGTANNVFWAVSGSTPDRELVVEWRDVEEFNCAGGTVKFQVVFFEGSSNILFNYADTTVGGSCTALDHGGSATVGMQISAGRAQQFSLNQAGVNDGTSLLWTAGGAGGAFSIVAGGTFNLAAGASQMLTVRFGPQTIGAATGTISVTSNGGVLSSSLTGLGTQPPPAIVTHPASQMLTAGQDGSFSVLASGSPTYQWQSSVNAGASWADLTNTAPYSGTTSATLGIGSAPQALNGTEYRAVATNSAGSATSSPATLTVVAFAMAAYDPTLKAPACGPGAAGCDSGGLLVGRDSMQGGGAEPNQPNTLLSSCVDGGLGLFHVDQSNDRIRISTLDGTPLSDGKLVRVEATVWARYGSGLESLDLYATSNPSASNPTWNYITTLAAQSAGAQVLSTTFALPVGSLQAVRARFRYFGLVGTCTSATSIHYDDHDDLVFGVASTAGTITGHVRDAGASPIAGALVGLSPGGVTATTDATGLYTLSVAAGTYAVTVSSPEYLPASSSVAVAALATTTRDFTLSPIIFTQAVYDGTLKAPKCDVGASGCDSGTLLVGRDTMAGGAEPNQPNTILNACADGTTGVFHFDESNDRLRISTSDGLPLAVGKTVRISATVWVFSVSLDFLDLYYTPNASAPSPTWTLLTTLLPSGSSQTLQTLTTTATLLPGSVQAVRAQWRFGGSASSCTAGTYNDRDDLVFALPTAGVPAITSQPASQSVTAGGNATFVVAASGAPLPAYQWQISTNGGASFLDLTDTPPFSGVATPALTLTGATLGQSGHQFRALAVNNAGVATSGAATLTVVSGATFVTLAGSGGHASVDGTGGAARFFVPWGAAVDSAGAAYVADANSHTIRKVTAGGVVTTVAGLAGSVGSLDGTGSAARFNFPRGLAIDSAGTLYIADASNHTIRQMTAAGAVSTLAGSAGIAGSTDGPAGDARFNTPYAVAVDAAGTVYVAEIGNDTIRKITAGVVTTLAGLAGAAGSANGTGSTARFNNPEGIAVDAAGTVYVADFNNQTIRMITAAGVVTTLAGLTGNIGSADGAGTAARFNFPLGVAVNSSTGTLYVADQGNYTIRAIAIASGAVTTLAGQAGVYGTADGTSSAARFYLPRGVAVASDGTVYATDSGNDMIRTISAGGVVATVAGASSFGSADGTAGAAMFFFPRQVAVDASGTVYVADSNNHTVRKITAAGVVTTLAGLAGSSGSTDGTGSAARFNTPSGVAVDSAGTVYVADSNNHSIRQITAAGVVTTFAGSAGTSGSADGAGINARFNFPRGLALDEAAGLLYVADTSNHTIRRISVAGVVTTLAGTAGSSGNLDGTGSAARFSGPQGTAVDGAGSVYVADTSNHTIRKITAAGVVTTLAGTAGSSGSLDGTGTFARFTNPQGVAINSVGVVYVADTSNNTIRLISTSGAVATLAGLAGVTGNADGTGGSVRFYSPGGVAVDSAGNVYVSDGTNSNIRKGTP